MFTPGPTNELVSISEEVEGGDTATFTRDGEGVWYQNDKTFEESPETASRVSVCRICKTGFYHDSNNLCVRYIRGFVSQIDYLKRKQPSVSCKECIICSGEKLADFDSIQNGGFVAYNRAGGFKRFGGNFHLQFARLGSTTDGISWLVEHDWQPFDEQDLGILESDFVPSITDYADYITKDDIMVTGLVFDQGIFL
jgi:hypothetical protein